MKTNLQSGSRNSQSFNFLVKAAQRQSRGAAQATHVTIVRQKGFLSEKKKKLKLKVN